MLRITILIIALTSAGCSTSSPRYKEVWEPYKATEYPLSAADAICTEYGVKVQQQQVNARNQSQKSQDVNVDVNVGTTSDPLDNYDPPDFGAGMFAGVPNAAAYNSCMAKLGYQKVEKCYKNCAK